MGGARGKSNKQESDRVRQREGGRVFFSCGAVEVISDLKSSRCSTDTEEKERKKTKRNQAKLRSFNRCSCILFNNDLPFKTALNGSLLLLFKGGINSIGFLKATFRVWSYR